jgi:hypothetical protein
MKQNIICYMLISNNKQLKYRVGGLGWECGILPRDKMSHRMTGSVETNTKLILDSGWDADNSVLAMLNAPALYYFKHIKVDKVRSSW